MKTKITKPRPNHVLSRRGKGDLIYTNANTARAYAKKLSKQTTVRLTLRSVGKKPKTELWYNGRK